MTLTRTIVNPPEVLNHKENLAIRERNNLGMKNHHLLQHTENNGAEIHEAIHVFVHEDGRFASCCGARTE